MRLTENLLSEFAGRNKIQSPINILGQLGSSWSYCIYQICKLHKNSGLLICRDAVEARETLQDLEFFLSLDAEPQSGHQLLFFPAWEFSPYKKLLPSTNTRKERLKTLFHLSENKSRPSLIITYPQALMQRTMPKEQFQKSTVLLKNKMQIDPNEIMQNLNSMGYQKADPVEDPGTYHMHGGILDIYSPAHSWPIRADLFDTEIEHLRFYNPITQRSILEESRENFYLIPHREMLCTEEALSLARSKIKSWSDTNNIPKQIRDRISEPLQNSIVTQEMDYFFPYFHSKVGGLEQYIAPDASIFWTEPDLIKSEASLFLEKLSQQYEESVEKHVIACPVNELYAPMELVEEKLEKNSHIYFSTLNFEKSNSPTLHFSSRPAPIISAKIKEVKSAKKSFNLDQMAHEFQSLLLQSYEIYFIANSQSQLDRLSFLLGQRGVVLAEKNPPPVTLLLGNLKNGFLLPEQKIAVLTEDEIFGKKMHAPSIKGGGKLHKSALSINPLEDLNTDDLVVHVDHGIGRYKGLVKLSPGGTIGDYVFLEYAGGDKLYLPIYRLETIQKYLAGGMGEAALDKLGAQQFAKTKEKVKSAVKDIAHKLLKIHALRASQEGYKFSEPDELFREFEASFPYDETQDQQKAIQDTLNDLCSNKPMDRLICGDVGFGKTEVAIRAAFKVCQEGKQVAILVPTTILAEQHFQNFHNRMNNFGVRVAGLSRFRSKVEQKKILEDLKSGKVDIIVGTHRLLSKDVEFHELGLLVIDEEQRFGVEHKEKLKQIRATTDVLTLTATPIPRTLHLALMGIRDISIILTPPENRLPIRTHLATFDKEIIKAAIENELSRGGQIFFIHNRVQSIDSIYELLHQLVPQAKIAIGHGQMVDGQLEKVMLSFYDKKFDILLSTTIIENGLDVPNANTIIVNRADTFGLSQLYQIRGRVGRSQTRAYAYFLIPESASISNDARERLSVLQRFTELGSGYAIATHDLELRGGGDILGDSQSGHISLVGYDMYLELLEEEILRLKGEEKKKIIDVEINCPFPAFLSDHYISDARSRLHLYKKLSNFNTEEEIRDAEMELRDRYGPLPPPAQELFWLLRIKVLARRLGFKGVNIGKRAISLQAGAEPQIQADKLLELVQKQPQIFSLSPDQKISIRGEYDSLKSVYDGMRHSIQSFASI